uniref:HTH myb-type domain-containing protein n=1 Tax=Oryza barthii TaxID=65489 RepID=A0A0D3ELK5_9ORYZ
MLEVSTLRSPKADQRAGVGGHHVVGFVPAPSPADVADEVDAFIVDDSCLLEYIDFSCCDVPFFHADDGDILPDLEVDPTELLAEFASSPDDEPPPTSAASPGEPAAAGGAKEDVKEDGAAAAADYDGSPPPPRGKKKDEEERSSSLLEEKDAKNGGGGGDEVLSAVTTEDSSAGAAKSSSPSAEGHSKRKPSSSSSSAAAGKNSHGKRKVKVDWTPELHRRFVQAVEQLGIDKAVPSRILELMGIEILFLWLKPCNGDAPKLSSRHATSRHCHGRPRMLHRCPLALFASFCHLRSEISVAQEASDGEGGGGGELDAEAADAARKWGPQAVTPGTPCMPPPLPPAAMLQRFPVPPVPGMVPHPMYRPIPPPLPPQGNKLAALQLQLDAHPSKESIDAAIGDVLVKPWLPLPLGLKPPSLDSVMSELHKQGIPKVPPAASGAAG